MPRFARMILVLGLLATPAFAGYDDFCSGFEEGYKAGWCEGSSVCMEPMVPMCPMAPIGRDNFQGGYAVGFKQALFAHR